MQFCQSFIDSLFRCNFEGCTKRYGLKCKLDKHMRSHTRDYACTVTDCDASFATWSELVAHTASRHPKHQCLRCDMHFSSSAALKRHTERHDGFEVVCPVDDCGKTFASQSNMRAHFRASHSDTLPFACPVPGCGATFAYKVLSAWRIVMSLTQCNLACLTGFDAEARGAWA